MTFQLNKARILVTRPEHQAEGLCRLIEQAGGIAVRFPVIKIEAIKKTAGINKSFNSYQWVIFISANAVRFALSGIEGDINLDKQVRIAAVGRSTAAAIQAAGMNVDLVPSDGFNTEALLATPEMQQISGVNCLIVRGEGGRELLAGVLRERGAEVDYLEVYRRTKPEVDQQEINRLEMDEKPDVIIVTSGESVQNLLELAGDYVGKILKSIPLVVISNRIKELAINSGFTRVAVSDEPSDIAIVGAVNALLNGGKK